MKSLFKAQLVAMTAAASVAGGALAQEIGDVTVQASHVERVKIARTSSGLPILELSVTHYVPYTDLDLTTSAGMAELQSRINQAALHGCREIDLAHRNAQPSDAVCARMATQETMAKIHAML